MGVEGLAARQSDSSSLWAKIDKRDLVRTVFTAFCALAVALGVNWPWDRLPVLALIGIVVGCWPIAVEAVKDLLARRMSMELSMLIAIAAAGAIGEWVTALVIAAFVLAAEILEDLSMDRGKDALTELMEFLPATVRVREGEQVKSVPLSELRVGEVVLVAPGGHIPVDGVVSAGASSVDQSRITGEPLPVEVKAGARVYAGSVNLLGALEVSATNIGADSSYGQIIAAVKEAQSSEPPVQRLADKLAAWLVYLAFAGAVITYVLSRDLTATISVIVVAGACGVAAGTPLAVLAAIARAARTGAFIKHGAYLEALSEVDTVIFDKTGTITTGAPRVTAVQPVSGISEQELVAFGASAEFYSEHPLGQAIVSYAHEQGIAVTPGTDFRYLPGQGVGVTNHNGQAVLAGSRDFVRNVPAQVSAYQGASAVYVSVGDTYLGAIYVADTIRASAAEAITQLRKRGYHTVMLTGDVAENAQAVAQEVGISEVHAQLLPEEKLDIIDRQRAAGHKVAMIGDGVNDAPALARAHVGIAVGSGAAIAQESADIVLISSDLEDLVAALHTARRARAIVMFNFIGTIAVDLIGMVLAAFGMLSPILAALIHVGSESAFILNSARLIPATRLRAAHRQVSGYNSNKGEPPISQSPNRSS